MKNTELIIEYRQLNRDIGKLRERLVSWISPEEQTRVYRELGIAQARCNELDLQLFKLGRV